MAEYYQIRSPLSQITEEKMTRFIAALSEALGEPLVKVSLERYLADDFALLYVASGGSEGYFLEVFEQLKARLEEEGLFRPEHKKKLPVFPKNAPPPLVAM